VAMVGVKGLTIWHPG